MAEDNNKTQINKRSSLKARALKNFQNWLNLWQKNHRIFTLCVGDVVARLQTIPQFFVSPLSTQSFLSTLWARNLLLFPAALHGIVTCFETFLSLGIALDSTVESYRERGR